MDCAFGMAKSRTRKTPGYDMDGFHGYSGGDGENTVCDSREGENATASYGGEPYNGGVSMWRGKQSVYQSLGTWEFSGVNQRVYNRFSGGQNPKPPIQHRIAKTTEEYEIMGPMVMGWNTFKRYETVWLIWSLDILLLGVWLKRCLHTVY